MKHGSRLLAAVVLCVALVHPVAANMLLNADFADPGVGGQINTVTIPNWTSWGDSGWYANDIDAQYSVKWWDPGMGIYQNWDATVGETYALSVQTYHTAGETLTSESAYLKVEWLDASYMPFASTVLDTMTSADSVGTWHTLSGTAEAPAGTVHGRITLGLEGDAGSGAAFFDNADVDVSAIPEPMTAIMLALGLGIVYRVRRRS